MYDITVDVARPRKSICNCLFAEERGVICKHMVAFDLGIFLEKEQQKIDYVKITNRNKRRKIMEQTMTQAKLEKILQYSESAVCDFKCEIYDMQIEESRISFLKDILSMANTIREDSAYIIIGVQQHDGMTKLQNVDANIDENQFLTFLKGAVAPEFPKFTYYTMDYGRYTLGIFEIGISNCGPFCSKKDFGNKIVKNAIYYRYGSSNTEASERMVAEITSWMRGFPNDQYGQLLEQAEYYDVDKYNYVLFVGDDAQLSPTQYALLGRIKWSMIVDMTKGSETAGFYKHMRPILEKQLSIHLLTDHSIKNVDFYEGKSLLWFMAGGEIEQNDKSLDNREWTRKYFKKILDNLQYMESCCTKKVIYINLFSGEKRELVRTIVGALEYDPLFLKYIKIDWNSTFDITEESGYVNVQGTLAGIFMTFNNGSETYDGNDIYRLPNGVGKYNDISNVSWIHEELEPLYENIEGITLSDEKSAKDFYEGGILKWNEMNPCKAVIRDKYQELIIQLEKAFEKFDSNCKVMRLDYRAGAGATTVLRMVGWHFHERYPVMYLRKYSTGSTIERIKAIYHDVDKARLLIVADEVTIDAQNIQDLKNKLLLEGIHAIILYSSRHLFASSENYLKEQLERGENKAFFSLYWSRVDTLDIGCEQKEQRKYALSNLKDGEMAQRTPFMYALTTYEKDFAKISDYVAAHLKDMTEEQENVFKVISVIQYFTGHVVPITIVEHELVTLTGRVSVRNKLSQLQKALLVFSTNEIRVVHHCVAEEILKFLCRKGLLNKEAWHNNLEYVFDYVISVLGEFSDNSVINEIITLLFLKKADDDSKHFANAIEELPDPIAKKRVLENLKVTFPDNAYVYSNLARFYHYIEENEPLALSEISEAISMREDYTFYHFKGIIMAKELSYYIEKNASEIRNDYSSFVDKVNEYRENVINAYDKSIELKYDNAYAYGSKVNFYLDIIRKFQKHVYPEKNREEFFASEKFYWCIRFLAEIEDTLRDISIMQEYCDLQFDIENYQNQVFEIQGDLKRALNAWDNMLTKTDVYRPNIRKKLVNGYYALYKHDWSILPKDKISYIQKILNDNIVEERDNAKNILQWFGFSRYFNGNLSKAATYFETEVENPNLQFYFYGMIVFTTYGIKNSDISSIRLAEKYGRKCEEYARSYPYRTNAREFYNPLKEDICAIESYADLKKNQENFDEILNRIPTVEGRIERIDKPEIGWIVVKDTELRVKFNPSWNPHRLYRKGKDENVLVKFVLGFRHEGVFAYKVEDIE